MWFKEGQPLSSLATKYESWKRKKVDGYEGDVKDEYNAKKSRPLKSCKAPLQKKENCDKNKIKQFPFY